MKIGIGLSGGGFRATLFNLGSLERLNELGLLKKIERITSVSGGSIASGVLAKNWHSLTWENGIATNFKQRVHEPLWDFCSEEFDVKAGLSGIFSWKDSIAEKVAKKYDERLFHGCKLADVKRTGEQPQFLFYGTSLQTRSAVRMVDGIYYDWKIGAVNIDDWSLARVVGISSAFPPVLAPVKIDMGYRDWEKAYYQKVYDNIKYKKRLILADGGVYDNMGMESLWKKSKNKLFDQEHEWNSILDDDTDICLISDAGGPTVSDPKPKSNWASITMRTLDLTIEQARSVRKRWFIDKLVRDEVKGSYWGITTKIKNYQYEDALAVDSDNTTRLAALPTRLNEFSDKDKKDLIEWGRALCDAAVNTHCKNLL